MAKNLKALGEVYDYPATGPVSSGDLIDMTDTVGVALSDGVAGDIVPVRVEGVFELPKAAATAITQGQKVYWNGSAIDTTNTGQYAGKAYVAAAADGTTVQVALNA